jgi:hypothetical protein
MASDVPHANQTVNAHPIINAIHVYLDMHLTQDFKIVYNAHWDQIQSILVVNNAAHK